jgi:hypothetical protein
MTNFNREKIKLILSDIVVKAYLSKGSEADLYKNTLDCFSCVIDSLIQGISIDEWMQQETMRQSQKTLQNSIGEFHQKVLATFPGVKDLGTGNIVDLVIEDKKIIAEIKNKWNTTKGNHKPNIYDDLEKILTNYSNNFVAYYVEMLPKNGKEYDEPFTPSDNVTKTRRPSNNRIRVIDGKSFYTLITGDSDAFQKLYCLIPLLVCEILNERFKLNRNSEEIVQSKIFHDLFQKIFPNQLKSSSNLF